jgi:hypothetical protein
MKKQKYTVSRGKGGNEYRIWDEHGNYFEEDLTVQQVQDLLNKNLLTKDEKRALSQLVQHYTDTIINSGMLSFQQLERLERKLK